MITTHSKAARYRVEFTNGTHTAEADVVPAKGGQNAGFGPHELMEASLACCINMWIRMQADKLCIPVGAIAVSVTLKRDHPEEASFEYSIKVDGVASEEQRTLLLKAADDCPVRRTLLKKLTFARHET
jgi:putative redox protein